jgi:outer membrane protein TolC
MAQETSLRASVMNQYYQTQQAERAVALEKQLLAVRQQELTDNEARFRAALIGVLDRERAFQTVRQYENNVRNTEDNLERSRLALLGTLGISAPTNFTLVTPLPPPGDTAGLNADSLVSIAMVRNPGLQQQEISLEQTRMNARLTRNSRFMPRVGLSASFGRGISQQGYSAFLDPGSRSTSLSSNIGISFSFSQLLDIPGTSLRLRQTAASEEDAALNLRDQRLNLERQVRTAVLDLRAAYRALDFAQQAVVNARLQVEVANAQLGAGTIPYFNYQSIVDGASQTERDVLNQQFNVLSRRIALDQLLGNRPGN